MGYGARALQALDAYYSGQYMNLDEVDKPKPSYPSSAAIPDVSPVMGVLSVCGWC